MQLHTFLKVCQIPQNAERLLKGTENGKGSRLFPPRIAKHDQHLGHRVDQGHYFKNGTFYIFVQKNGKPHGKVLAATLVNPKMDSGEDVVNRLEENARKGGCL
jgi:hypothetical protein